MTTIHHFRNATMVIETESEVILVDPMLGAKGTQPTFTFFRFKAQKNPIVELPQSCLEILNKVTHCVITHLHPDHLDKKGEEFLINNNIPVTCSYKDVNDLKKRGLNVVNSIEYWKQTPFLNGTIEGIPARHGYGLVAKPMRNVMGYYIKLSNEDSIYLSSDTIYTEDVHKVLTEYNPTISVVAGGTAQLDLLKPLLMTKEDVIKFAENTPNKVIVNHLEAVNHCPTTRTELKNIFTKKGLISKVSIPEDGEVISF